MSLHQTLLFLFFILFSFLKTLAQDTLIFENQWPFPVIIEEEREREIIYRRPDLQNSPAYIMEKRFVTRIGYQDPEAGKLKFKSSPFPKKKLEILLLPMDSSAALKGSMVDLNDSTLFLRKKYGFLEGGGRAKAATVHKFSYQNIRRIEVRQRERIAKHAFWGAAGGFALGMASGLIIFKDDTPCDTTAIDGPDCHGSLSSPQTKWEKSLKLGFAGAGAGFIGGGMVGSVRLRFIIGGSKNNFNQTIPKLEKLAR